MSKSTTRTIPTVLVATLLVLSTALPPAAFGAEAITDANVAEKMAVASTPAEHQDLAAYFTSKAQESAKEVARHEAMRDRQFGKSRTRMNQHCRALIRAARAQQEAYEDFAVLQMELAEEAAQ